MELARISITPKRVNCCIRGKPFQLRRCGGSDMWSVLVPDADAKWVNVCFFTSPHVPLKWISLLYSQCAQLTTPVQFRQFLLKLANN